MQVSVRTLYGLRALTELGLHPDNGPMHARDVAETLGMSKDYLNQIFAVLKSEGIVRSKKGPHGGYRLGRPPREITLAEVMSALEDPVLVATCTEPALSDCERIERCSTQTVLSQVAFQIESILEEITLADFCNQSNRVLEDPAPVSGGEGRD